MPDSDADITAPPLSQFLEDVKAEYRRQQRRPLVVVRGAATYRSLTAQTRAVTARVHDAAFHFGAADHAHRLFGLWDAHEAYYLMTEGVCCSSAAAQLTGVAGAGPEWSHVNELGARCPHRLVVDVELTVDGDVGFVDAGAPTVTRSGSAPMLLQLECNVPNRYAAESCWRATNINNVLRL